MAAILWVFIGGGLGSICRFGISRIFVHYSWQLYLGTLAANILSCILLGFLIGLQFRSGLDLKYKWLLMSGFCGGFSTFSTFSGETFFMLQQQQYLHFFLYTLFSVILCLLAIILGYRMS